MKYSSPILKFTLAALFCLYGSLAIAQPAKGINWTADGSGYYQISNGNIIQVTLPSNEKKIIVGHEMLRPQGKQPLEIKNFQLSADGTKVLIYTNSKKVWRYETRGDYWIADLKTGKLHQVGKDRPASSLMFAKFSPDASRIAYVSAHNIYVESTTAGGTATALTTDGTDRLINGTFDWVYEEEFDCRDGFRWSPDGLHIAYWQLDARKIRNFLMINNTDSIYPLVVPVEYPKVGEAPSSCRIGVVDLETATTTGCKSLVMPYSIIFQEWTGFLIPVKLSCSNSTGNRMSANFMWQISAPKKFKIS